MASSEINHLLASEINHLLASEINHLLASLELLPLEHLLEMLERSLRDETVSAHRLKTSFDRLLKILIWMGGRRLFDC